MTARRHGHPRQEPLPFASEVENAADIHVALAPDAIEWRSG